MKKTAAWLIGLTIAVAGPSVAYAQPGKTLAECQRTVALETQRYTQNHIKRQFMRSMGSCLDQIAKIVIRDQDATPPRTIAAASRRCQQSLLKLENSARPRSTLLHTLQTRIARACDPAVRPGRILHDEADLVGDGTLDEQLDARNLDAWCGSFGGDGSIDGLDEWVECLAEVASCTARQQLTMAFPRILEWLAAVRPAILAADPSCVTSCASCASSTVADACDALDALAASIDGTVTDELPEFACGPGTSQTSIGGSSPLPVTGQTTSYGSGSDGDLQVGVAHAFTDNGDGTITDAGTGLMWEKKNNHDFTSPACATATSAASCANPHDVNNRYSWCLDDDADNDCDNGIGPFDGSVTTLFLDQLNNHCDADASVSCDSDADCSGVGGPCGFAGYRDWRLPNITELHTLINFETTSTAYPAFNIGCSASCDVTAIDSCSCPSGPPWSSTTTAVRPAEAMRLAADGRVFSSAKTTFLPARAVRGGP